MIPLFFLQIIYLSEPFPNVWNWPHVSAALVLYCGDERPKHFILNLVLSLNSCEVIMGY